MKTFILTAAAVGAIWIAPRPAAAQVINACVRNRSGELRIASACKKDERPLSWNAAGAAGPAGPAGPQGVPGPAGPSGPPGQLSPIANVQQLNLVNASNQVLASLATTSDGNVLTFFDSSGKKTITLGNDAKEDSAALETWDGNNIIPGTGISRAAFGEDNTSNVTGGGFGLLVIDSTGKYRVGAGLTFDDKIGYLDTFDPNGSVAGISDDDTTQSQGFFTQDLNGTLRSFTGNSLDGTTFNETALFNSAGQLRTGLFNTATNGDGFETVDDNGNIRSTLSTSTDDSVTGFEVFDGTSLEGTERLFAGLTPSGSSVDTYDASHTLTGHLP